MKRLRYSSHVPSVETPVPVPKKGISELLKNPMEHITLLLFHFINSILVTSHK
jgi:hypothetical protein